MKKLPSAQARYRQVLTSASRSRTLGLREIEIRIKETKQGSDPVSKWLSKVYDALSKEVEE